ncbi:MAG: photosynthetic reaction center subunit H [bacterium]
MRDDSVVPRGYAGAPVEPQGNPLLSGMGPAAYANRADRVDLTYHGEARIVPLRAAPGFYLNPRDPDPRGMDVVAADGVVAGTVIDVWVDRAEPSPRYYEVAVAGGSEVVLLPATVARVKARHRQLRVKSILAHQFADVPRTARPDRVTLLEEDKIQAYYAGGYMYATAERREPLF